MTFDEADARIKYLKGPFAVAIEREPDNGRTTHYIGWPPCWGVGSTWEEAFTDMKPSAARLWFRTPRRVHKCAYCRGPREILKARSGR